MRVLFMDYFFHYLNYNVIPGGLDNCVKLWDTSKLNEERERLGQEWWVYSVTWLSCDISPSPFSVVFWVAIQQNVLLYNVCSLLGRIYWLPQDHTWNNTIFFFDFEFFSPSNFEFRFVKFEQSIIKSFGTKRKKKLKFDHLQIKKIKHLQRKHLTISFHPLTVNRTSDGDMKTNTDEGTAPRSLR